MARRHATGSRERRRAASVAQAALVVALLLGLTVEGGSGAPAPTERVSVSSTGAQGSNISRRHAFSADGQVVAFTSIASDLVAGDTNGAEDVFVRDQRTGTTERVSVSSTGEQANGDSFDSFVPALSTDGRFVVFGSLASNLVPGDTNGSLDVFIHDRKIGTTERVSIGSAGEQANASSYHPAISADGRFVAFDSDASNLVPGDTNGSNDIFIRDRQAGTTERISVAANGAQADGSSGGAALSADGRFVAFLSEATNLVAGDTNGFFEVFVRDRQAGTTERVSVASDGTQANGLSRIPDISADGRFVAFDSGASNLVAGDTNGIEDVFVRDRRAGTTERVNVSSTGEQANANSSFPVDPALSADGRFVAFGSGASNLVPGDTDRWNDVFVHDRQTGATERVSIGSAGEQANDNSLAPAISADGRFVGFTSVASNLVAGDTNGVSDVFVRDRRLPPAPPARPSCSRGHLNAIITALAEAGAPDAFYRPQNLRGTGTAPAGSRVVAQPPGGNVVVQVQPAEHVVYQLAVADLDAGRYPGLALKARIQGSFQALAAVAPVVAADGQVAALHTGPGLPGGFAYRLNGDEVTVYNVPVIGGAHAAVYLVTRVTAGRGFITANAAIAGEVRAGRLASVPGVCGDSVESRVVTGQRGVIGTPTPLDLVPGQPY